VNALEKEFNTYLTIKRIGINGEGVGFYKHKAVFVGGALPDEEIICRFTKEHKNYIEGEVVRLKRKSPHRVDAPCPYFGRCGGCQLQHLKYEEQLKMKKDLVVQSLERYYHGFKESDIKIKETIGMNDPYNYRNKAQLPVAFDGQKIQVGLFELNSNNLIHIDKCIIQEDYINRVIHHLKDLCMKHDIKVYNHRTKTGLIRTMSVRYIDNTNECQVVLVLQNKEIRKMKQIAEELMNLIPQVMSFYVNINEDIESREMYGPEFIHIMGKETIEAKIGELTFFLSPRSFFQLNTRQTKVLYDVIREVGRFKDTDKVIDAYCGAGTIGQYIADKVAEVRGVDLVEDGILDAKDNAKLNKLTNTHYDVGLAEEIIPQWINEGFKPNVVIMDPPRTGIDFKLLDLLRRIKVDRIIYVSCNPSTLAKDLNELRRIYDIKSIQPLDMFPQTSHVESVVLLVRK
jgi:23S rRNA (uracil1939-C5)-methyltransferase